MSDRQGKGNYDPQVLNVEAIEKRLKKLEHKLIMHIASPTGEGHTVVSCEGCGAIHKKGTLKRKPDISGVTYRLCPYCHNNWK